VRVVRQHAGKQPSSQFLVALQNGGRSAAFEWRGERLTVKIFPNNSKKIRQR
jgi:hypothetical protein